MKVTALALLAVGANAARHELNIFAPQNFKNVMKELIDEKAKFKPYRDTGKVTWKQCNDDFSDYTLDQSATTTSPAIITKGVKANMDIEGAFGNPAKMTKCHVHVLWNGSVLYDQDLPGADFSDETMSEKFGWDVPSFAPSGHYQVTFTGTGTDDISAGKTGNIFVVEADFDL